MKQVWVVLYWYDHGEAKVDSAWSFEKDAVKRSCELGKRYCDVYVVTLDENLISA